MTTNGFFRWVWRANALVILGGGAILTLAGLLALAQIGLGLTRARPLQNTARIEGASDVRETLSVGSFAAVAGTPFFAASLSAEQRYGSSSRDKVAGSVRNLLLFDSRDGSARRILPDEKAILTQIGFVPAGISPGGERRPARGALFVAHRADSNGDGSLDSRDAGELVIAPLDRAELVPLAAGVTAVLGIRETAAGTIFAFIRVGTALRYVEIDPARPALLREGPIDLPNLPPS